MEIVTREIMWNIPSFMKTSMYILLLASLLVMIKGFYSKFQSVGLGHRISWKGLLPKKLNWLNFFRTILFQGKIGRNKAVGLTHALIFYGFVILWIATDLVAIHADTPFKIYQGTLYITVSFLADIAGIMILLGIAAAFYRRYILRPDYLSATYPKQELYMYSMLLALVILGYLLEGLRIEGTRNAFLAGEKVLFNMKEKIWSPVGWILADAIHALNWQEKTLVSVWQGTWFIHMVNTMAFVALIPYSKFSHMFIIPLNALLTPKRRGGVLSPMNFEDESAETFGLGKLSELTPKNRFDLLACVECGRCSQVCPAKDAGKPLDPKLIITKIRDFSENTYAHAKNNNANLWDTHRLYQANELDACTTCGACMEECPADIEHVNLIMEAKRYKTLTLGEIPPTAADTTNKIKINGNPWGISQEDRFNWADGMDVPIIDPSNEVDYLYYVGCAGSYDSANQKVVKDTVLLLKKAGVSFAVMGKTEKCNGDPIRRFGDEYTFYEIAIENIANMKQYKFKKVVTHCPHCLHTIGKEYAQFENGDFETIHHTELLAELVNSGALTPKNNIEQKLTFHDPCYLGRHHGAYNAPREILNAIPGIKLDEMKRTKDKALCCGMGGGNMWYELPEGEHLAKNRLQDIAEVQPQKLATACSYCLINFNSSKSQNTQTEGLEIDDVASILAKSIL